MNQISMIRITLILNIQINKHYQKLTEMRKSHIYLNKENKNWGLILIEENEYDRFGRGGLKGLITSGGFLVSIQNGTWLVKSIPVIRFILPSSCDLLFQAWVISHEPTQEVVLICSVHVQRFMYIKSFHA